MQEVGQLLVSWYDQHGRDLPWRREVSAYKTLVSEAMLQQTQVHTALDYFNRFVKRFPDIQALAQANFEDVLTLWSGLGYYRRARHLHLAAQNIHRHGSFPRTAEQLRQLPGIGPYSANAIASIAFQEPVAVVDGNVKRVLSRLTAYPHTIDRASATTHFQAVANALLLSDRPGDFNQAMMELGALICRPKQPACPICPLRSHCQAFQQNLVAQLPIRKAPGNLQHLSGIALLIINRRGELLLTRNPPPPLKRQGMWEVPVAWQVSLADIVLQYGRHLRLNLNQLQAFSPISHAITTNRMRLHPFAIFADVDQRCGPDHVWHNLSELPRFPISGLCKKTIRLLGGPLE